METSLRLRLSDGAATVRFQPRLTTAEYAELEMRVVDTATRAEFQTEVTRLAAKWGKECDFNTQIDRH